ncbi:hypothetical protein [Phytohabitans rumicis]|uniref:Uncharacterized protein n=1 Tax=Phytohabitans rumicis TaxID=1076125 RepID=A0A6V8KZP7_9ACTN|nr:hypothetical protein [Phytohabitans rumicis]GFJ87286.1 hypothetical protein Prum_009280 [Phytohabitans rumicis]
MTERVYRVRWMPGTDTLFGVCHCGAERAAQEPVQLWDWLLGHPAGHEPPDGATNERPRDAERVPA